MSKVLIEVSLEAVQSGNAELLMCEAKDYLESKNVGPKHITRKDIYDTKECGCKYIQDSWVMGCASHYDEFYKQLKKN